MTTPNNLRKFVGVVVGGWLASIHGVVPVVGGWLASIHERTCAGFSSQ